MLRHSKQEKKHIMFPQFNSKNNRSKKKHYTVTSSIMNKLKMSLTGSISFSNVHVVIVNAFGHNNHVVKV